VRENRGHASARLGARPSRRGLTGALPQLAGRLHHDATLFLRVASESQNAAITRNFRQTLQETAMFALTKLSRSTQRAVCMLVAAVIVAASLTIGAYGSQAPLHEGYSVTITQLQ
jgi:hypothetical protein